VFTASPNVAAPATKSAAVLFPFNQAALFVPGREAADKSVGFGSVFSDSSDNVVTQGFQIIQKSVAVEESRARFLQGLWCAVPTDEPGIWELTWNETSPRAGSYPISLRNIPAPAGATFEEGFNPDATCRSDV